MEATEIAKSMMQKKRKLPDIRPGDVVRVHERVEEGGKTRVAVFEGTVIARRHGLEPGATITVRKITKGGYGIERIFPLYLPTIEKFEVTKRANVRRAKLFYLRKRSGKRATLRGKRVRNVAIASEESERVEGERPEETDAGENREEEREGIDETDNKEDEKE